MSREKNGTKNVPNENEKTSKIIVYDAIMGSGKTYDAIKRMKEYVKKDIKFIYITPFLDEGDRIINELPKGSIYKPLSLEDNGGKGVYEAQWDIRKEDGTIDLNVKTTYKLLNKRAQLLNFALKGNNIISTHALFLDLKKEDYPLFKDYILILDEVVTPLKIMKIGRDDIQILIKEGLVLVNEDTNEVKFVADNYNDNAFRSVKKLCNNSTIYHLDKDFFIWIFPIDIFKTFREVQVLTYLFNGSILAYYFKMYEIKYTLHSNNTKKQLSKIKNLLNIYQGKLNQTVGLKTFFSKTWSEKINKNKASKITNATSYIFKKVFKTKSKENAYTTFKDVKSKFAGNSYSRGFIPINARATNDYSQKKSMAYLGNRYFNPQIKNFFIERGIEIDEDLWALSELVQWLWRGCIREYYKKMNVFIPSIRMRNLLLDWLDGKYLIKSFKTDENMSIEIAV